MIFCIPLRNKTFAEIVKNQKVFVCWDHSNKAPQTVWLRTTEIIVLQFQRQEIPSQGVRRLILRAVRGNRLHASRLTSSGFLAIYRILGFLPRNFNLCLHHHTACSLGTCLRQISLFLLIFLFLFLQICATCTGAYRLVPKHSSKKTTCFAHKMQTGKVVCYKLG